ncbi:MAG: phosphotransferase [Maritimibacter sp.]
MATSPDVDLARLWADVVAPNATWKPFSGGNTNALWRVGDVVIKRFVPGAETPLFGNDPAAEALALSALKGTGLAPDLIDVRGESLAYAHIEGQPWRRGDGVACVARVLSQLHKVKPPAGLPRAAMGAAHLTKQTLALGETAPETPSLAKIDPVFLHGDATASNALVRDGTVIFIDWQCPALGDPCDDIAVFLSPAMQVVSGNEPLEKGDIEAFLEAYDDPKVTTRYRSLAPLYRARMSAYCKWRAARGDAGYSKAAMAEITAGA